MSSLDALLGLPRLTAITGQVDHEVLRIRDVLEHKVIVEGRSDLEEILGKLLALATTAKPTPKTLDLVGHSIAGASVLQLGDWVIDCARPGVTAFFRELAEHDVLPRLGVYAIRLLGCRTAETPQARRTICTLSEILGLEVHGTTGIVFANHYNSAGFDDQWRFLLIGASDLRASTIEARSFGTTECARYLDIDGLPAGPIDSSLPWQVRVADAHASRAILRLIRRNDGALMPGLLALPRCEVAMPSGSNGACHRLQLVLDGDFIRVYPEGPSKLGVLYPVTDPHLLRTLVDELPLHSASCVYGEETQRTPMAY